MGVTPGRRPQSIIEYLFMNKAHGMKNGGMAASKMGAVKTGKTPDGIATKGKTKGTMIAMKNGGKC